MLSRAKLQYYGMLSVPNIADSHLFVLYSVYCRHVVNQLIVRVLINSDSFRSSRPTDVMLLWVQLRKKVPDRNLYVVVVLCAPVTNCTFLCLNSYRVYEKLIQIFMHFNDT